MTDVLLPFDHEGKESKEQFAEAASFNFLSHNENSIFTTIGVYPNSTDLQSCKINGVSRDSLKDHIWYNLTYRPGRALYVNGVLVYGGANVKPSAELLIAIQKTKISHDTAPYH